MASASKNRRSRKRRPKAGSPTLAHDGTSAPDGTTRSSGASAARGGGGARAPRQPQPTTTLGQRPRAPWHPLPLSEVLILVGAVGTIVGLRELNRAGPHSNQGRAPLAAGLVAVGLGVFEVTTREHFSGYRSHAIMLALLPVLVLHTVVVLAVSVFAAPPRFLSIALLPLDVALFVFLFKLLRARFLEARRARAGGR